MEALAHAQNALRGDVWRQKAALILSDVRGGKTLAESLQLHQFIDATGVNLVRVGERSGALGKTTASLAQCIDCIVNSRCVNFNFAGTGHYFVGVGCVGRHHDFGHAGDYQFDERHLRIAV
jgi:hypothetical protein